MTLKARYGPWALIAGASEGTGAEFARLLAAEGFGLILVARRREPLEALAAELGAAGTPCVCAAVDLALPDAAKRLVEAAGGREVGLLILNAGADSNGAQFLDAPAEAWRALAMRNVMTVMDACHAFAAPMRQRGRGGIIVMGSGACYGGLPGIAVYGATKAFDLVFAEGLWAELKPHGVDVLSYVIGRTDTPAHRRLMEEKGLPVPDGLADAGEVARLGLARLPHGPVANWGLADDEAGYAGTSAAQRRERIIAISRVASHAGARR